MLDMKTGEIWKIEYSSDEEASCGELVTNYWLVLKRLTGRKLQLVFLGSSEDEMCFTVMSKYDIEPEPEMDKWERL